MGCLSPAIWLRSDPGCGSFFRSPDLRNTFIDFMDEIHRVLKPGGFLFHSTPAYPSPAAFQGPIHVNIIAEEVPCIFVRDLVN